MNKIPKVAPASLARTKLSVSQKRAESGGRTWQGNQFRGRQGGIWVLPGDEPKLAAKQSCRAWVCALSPAG